MTRGTDGGLPGQGKHPGDAMPSLGSFTRPERTPAAGTAVCASCGSDRLTRLALQLADGTAVTFVSCRLCERRAWIPVGGDGTELTRDQVIELSSRPRTGGSGG